MSKLRVAINGFGRIGRSFFRSALLRDEIDIVAVNDLGDVDNLLYLLKYDSAQGRRDYKITSAEDKKGFVVDDEHVAFVSEREPGQLPWGEFDIDVVIESTGFFTKYEDARAHLNAGAKHVVISAPAKGDPIPEVGTGTVLMGINEDQFATCSITSNASCTTNATSPVIQILHETVGVKKAMLSTVHAYTSTQSLVDLPDKKDWRRGRAAAQNIIPTSTGAAQATTLAITDLEGKFDGISMRVPVVAGSVSDITFLAGRDTTVEEVNTILKAAAALDRWKPVFSYTEEPLVSSDIIGAPFAAIADLAMTRVVDGDLVKVLSWYDNEAGYTHSLVEHALKAGSYVKAK